MPTVSGGPSVREESRRLLQGEEVQDDPELASPQVLEIEEEEGRFEMRKTLFQQDLQRFGSMRLKKKKG